VETPDEIFNTIDAYLNSPVLTPANAFVTGYDFLIDQANAITTSLTAQGVNNQTHLINDTWTAQIFSDTLFNMSVAPDLMSLNSHFEHYRFFPNDANDIYATQIGAMPDFAGTLVFSVGCHSGLSVDDDGSLTVLTGTDWAQSFLRQQAMFVGNTGFGYGDTDLVAYSEQLMVNFVDALGDWSEGPQTVGQALVQAKQLYYNSLAAGTFSNYDEKVMSELTLYGLPMARINMPVTTTVPLKGYSVANAQLQDNYRDFLQGGSGSLTSTLNLSFNFESHNMAGIGTYYTLAGEDETYVAGGRPIQPRATYNVHITDTIIHGALMVGGTFTEVPNFNPYVSQVLTDELYIQAEPLFDVDYWYPVGLGTINRFLSLDGQSDEQLVVVPGQFKAAANSSPTVGTERLYTNLQFEVYHNSVDNTDFEAPHIWHVGAKRTGNQVNFGVAVEDDIGATPRVVVLYRELPSTSWQMVELTYNPTLQVAVGSVQSTAEVMAYFVQAVDSNGNVSLALNHGNEWLLAGGSSITPTPSATPTAVPPEDYNNYLPFIRKND
jgi:hypothetical protein